MTLTTRSPLEDEIVERLRRLPKAAQERVLDLTRELADAALQGTPGRDLLRFVGLIDPADLGQMRDAIESECERIDASDW